MPQPTQPGGTPPRTNIPMMRRERRQSQEAANRALRETRSREHMRQAPQMATRQAAPSGPRQAPPTGPRQMPSPDPTVLARRRYEGGEVRWDPNTGELTSSDKGRPSQVKPGEYVKDLGTKTVPGDSVSRQAEPKGASSFGVRLRKMARGGDSKAKNMEPAPSSTDPAAGAFTSERPAWHGASGRTALVAPVKDNRDVQPLNVPAKAVAQSPVQAGRSNAPMETIMASPPVSPTSGVAGNREAQQPVPTPQQQPTMQPQETGASSYPSPPLSGTATPPAAQKQIKRKPPPQHHQHQDSVSSVYSQADGSSYGQQATPTPARSATYSPSEAWTQSPITDYSPAPQNPGKALVESMMDRRRPAKLGHADVGPAPGSPIKISMGGEKLWHGNATAYNPVMRSSSANERPPSRESVAGSVHKTLPPNPGETGATDRVSQLNAQLSSLAQRRINITRSIKQMTELMPTDGLLASDAVLLKRRDEERKVEGLKSELSDIQREEYELGLKLHRAYKRMDKDATYEPTTLWVRRVTG